MLTPLEVPRRDAPASISAIACSLVLIPPEAFTPSPAPDTVSNINLTSSTFAPTPPLTNPVEVLTKLAPAEAESSDAILISSFVSRSVSKITFKLKWNLKKFHFDLFFVFKMKCNWENEKLN